MAYETTPLWAAGTADRFTAKLREVCRRSAGKIPARAIDGVHDNKADGRAYNPDDGLCWWTNGFWAGMLWRAFAKTGEAAFAEAARFTEVQLDACFTTGFYGLHHDVGFMWLPSAVADYRLTGDPDARRRGLRAASAGPPGPGRSRALHRRCRNTAPPPGRHRRLGPGP